MNLRDDWLEIRRTFARAPYASMATIDSDGHPHVTPIGSLFLDKEPGRGFWFEKFTSRMPRNLDANPKICVLAVDMRLRLWLRALVSGRFPSSPGFRLAGTAGARRPATEREMSYFHRRVRPFRWTKGYDLLWRDFSAGREVVFDEVKPIRLGAMWPPRDAAPASSASPSRAA
ncbi:MAG: pyridoxamine 5'-phosphate oxidase family protein [Thermoanaerobaculia bacterium]|nr:pyridoxamine 5'-phosphate oxidase family protein [Thermoanaerobaculia bacterium]